MIQDDFLQYFIFSLTMINLSQLRQKKISDAEAAAGAAVKKSAMELKVELLTIMQPGENVVQTMRRLSGKSLAAGSKTKKRFPKSQNGDNAAAPVEIESHAQKLAHRIALEQFTDVVDELLSTGLSSVYDMTYEAIETSAVRWEYRGLDGVIHGPFVPQVIASWKSQGYFSGSSSVMMRKVGVIGRDWGDDIDPRTLDLSASSSSVSSVSVTSKVKFNFGGSDTATESASKKMKASTEDSSAQDLMNDLNDDDDEEPSSCSAGNVHGIIPVSSRIEDEVRGQWTSSDDIDFDIHVEDKADDVDDADVDDDEDDI